MIGGEKFFQKIGGEKMAPRFTGFRWRKGAKKKKKGKKSRRNKRETFQIPFKPQVHIPQILANTATNPNCGHSGVRIKERVTSNNRCNDWKLLNHSLESEGKGGMGLL